MTLPQQLWSFISKYLASLETSCNTFNPWESEDLRYDLESADSIRRENLKSYLSLFDTHPRVLVVGEAPGWRGCRFSGVPFTSEIQLIHETIPVEGRQSSNELPFKEASAQVVWSILKPYKRQVFLWNAFPIHPHPEGKPLANRNPSMKEIELHGGFLLRLSGILGQPRVVAIGRKAESVLKSCGFSPTYVRHPSHGGQSKFKAGMIHVLREEGLL